MEALTINNLAPYLPFGLRCKIIESPFYNEGFGTLHKIGSNGYVFIKGDTKGTGWEPALNEFKPICFPLDNLTKPITINGETFVPAIKLVDPNNEKGDWDKMSVVTVGDPKPYYKVMHCELGEIINIYPNNIRTLPYYLVQKLFEWKFAINLPEESWIDVNSLEENPYK